MEGDVTDINVTETNNVFGTIILKRAAAKVIVDIPDTVITGYTPGEAKVRLVNGISVTSLSEDYQCEVSETQRYNAERILKESGDENKSYFMDRENAIYTYSNKQRLDIDRESFVTLEVIWTNNTTGNTRPYYYRIPFSYIESSATGKNRIQRNYIYKFTVNVTQLGGLSPDDALNLNANFDIIDCTLDDISGAILEYDYLYVYYPNSIAHNYATYQWEYKSASAITISNIKAICEQYLSDGSIKNIEYKVGEPQYPIIEDKGISTDGKGKYYISLSSMVPINYVPLDISFTVTNESGLKRDVTHRIYPPIYVTASFSNGGKIGRAHV